MIKQGNQPVKFQGGAHSEGTWAGQHLQPFFDSGTITPYPGADYYAVCYGELCAYSNWGPLLAVWSAPVPDCEEDAGSHPDYHGSWEVQLAPAGGTGP